MVDDTLKTIKKNESESAQKKNLDAKAKPVVSQPVKLEDKKTHEVKKDEPIT